AATIAAIVETFTVWARSPPVPTMSSTGPSTDSGVASSSMTLARPATSATVSPLARNATANPAICEGVAAPVMISLIAHAVSSAVRCSPATRADNSAGQVVRASMGFSRGGLRWSGGCLSGSAVCTGPPGGGRWSGPGDGATGAAPQQARDGVGQRDRVDRVRGHHVGPRPRRQPPVLATADDEAHRGTVVDLVLGLLADAHAARGPR